MRQWARVLPFLIVTACAGVSLREPAATNAWRGRVLQNELQPFTSDGCSSFPNGIPGDEKKWQRCCVIHDVSYWQGGTEAQREQADWNLRQCVAATGETDIADAMYMGVRFGGAADLPTTWHWGYGWTIDRGTGALSSDELSQVEKRRRDIPGELDKVGITKPPMVAPRASLTNDLCLDQAIGVIEKKLGRGFRVLAKKDADELSLNGVARVLAVKVEGCEVPFEFRFKLGLIGDCKKAMSEVSARMRIRLEKVVTPATCSATAGNP